MVLYFLYNSSAFVDSSTFSCYFNGPIGLHCVGDLSYFILEEDKMMFWVLSVTNK